VELLVLLDLEVSRELAQQGRLARVGVAGERDQIEPGVASALPAVLFGLLDPLEFVVDPADLGLDVPLATLVVLAQPHEPGVFLALGEARLRLRSGQFVPELRQFDLELCLPGLGALAEDLEDQRESVDDLDAVGQELPRLYIW